MIGCSSYAAARLALDLLNAEVAFRSKALQVFPRGPDGRVSDAVMFSPEYRAAKLGYDSAFNAVRNFMPAFLKAYGKQYRADLHAEREARAKALPPAA